METLESIAEAFGLQGDSLELPNGEASPLKISGVQDGDGGRRAAFAGAGIKDIDAYLAEVDAGLVIVDRVHSRRVSRPVCAPRVAALWWSDNARLDFCRLLNRFFQPGGGEGVSPLAAVAESASLGEGVAIGHGCVVGDDVEVGDGCVLHANVTLYRGTRLGERVVVHSGSVLGADGFGFERRPDGSLEKFPHYGNVVIGDDVEIGANVTVDRGTIGDTVVGRGVKIDNNVQVAHNVSVGEDSLVIAGAVLCGGAAIGARCWIAPNSVVAQKQVVGDDATLGMGAVVGGPVPSKETMVGYQARPVRAAKRIATFLGKIGDPPRRA